MSESKFKRHPQSAPGDFYVIQNECIICGVPHALAPELMDWTKDGYHCIWKKQPETEEEIEQAIRVLENQEAGCHRYAGTDLRVLQRVPECCDHLPQSRLLPRLFAFLSTYGKSDSSK